MSLAALIPLISILLLVCKARGAPYGFEAVKCEDAKCELLRQETTIEKPPRSKNPEWIPKLKTEPKFKSMSALAFYHNLLKVAAMFKSSGRKEALGERSEALRAEAAQYGQVVNIESVRGQQDEETKKNWGGLSNLWG